MKETKAADLDKLCNDDEEYPADADKTKCREDNEYQVSQYDCSNDFISVAKQWDPTTNPNQGYPGGQCCYVMAMSACEPNSIVNFYEMYYCMFKGSTLAFLPISVSTIFQMLSLFLLRIVDPSWDCNLGSWIYFRLLLITSFGSYFGQIQMLRVHRWRNFTCPGKWSSRRVLSHCGWW